MMNYRTSNHINNDGIAPSASQLSREYMGEIRKSLDNMEKILSSKHSQNHHSYKSSRVNPQDEKKHYFFTKEFENQRLTVDITIEQSPRDSRTKYIHTFYEQPKQVSTQPNYFEYNNYFSQKSAKRDIPIQRRWINSKNLHSQRQFNHPHIHSRQQQQFQHIQTLKNEQSLNQLPRNNQTSNFNCFANQILSKQEQTHKNKQKQAISSRQQSQSNIEMEDLIFEPADIHKSIFPSRLSSKAQQYHSNITESLSIKQPSNTFMLSSFEEKHQPITYFKTAQKAQFQPQQSSTLKKTFDISKTKFMHNSQSGESFQYRSSRKNADELLTARKKSIVTKVQPQSPHIASEGEVTFGFASSESISRTDQAQKPHKIIINSSYPQHQTHGHAFHKSKHYRQQDTIANQNNQISFNPQSYLKNINKHIKTELQTKKKRIRQSKPIVIKDNDHHKTNLLKKIQQRQKSNPLKARLTHRYEDLHGSLSPRWKNISNRLYNNSTSKSPCTKYSKYQYTAQRDLFKSKVKKQYNFIHKYLTDPQIEDIYNKLQKSNIPQSHWVRQVFHQARKRNNYCKHCL